MVKLLTGLERYDVERALKRLTSGIDESEMSVLDGKFDELSVKRLAEMTSIFSERKAIICRCRQLSANDLKAIKRLSREYAGADVCIVVMYESPANGAAAAMKEVSDLIQKYDKYAEQDHSKLLQYINVWANENGVRATRSGAEELLKRSEYYNRDEVNLHTVRMLVEQVALLGDITLENVETAIADTPAAKAWQLIDYLVKHDGKGLVENAHKILESRESTEIGLLQLLAKPFRLAWLEHVVGTGSTGAKNYTFEKVIRLSDDVLEQCADIIDKGIQNCMGGLKPRVAFDLAVAELIETV